jgi:hypothetical protein
MSSQTVASSRAETPGSRADIPQRTLRQDRWWLQPLVIAVGLTGFVIYATWAAFNHPIVAGTAHRIYYAHPYLSPLYSPCFVKGCPPQADWAQLCAPQWISPAIYILIFPLAFRATCYYYRKAYYRSFWLSPPACAVAEPHRRYTGETRFPLLGQNLHRYFFYAAVILSAINTYDALYAFVKADGSFGLGLGNLILLGNVILLWAYTISCHSCRSIMGGRLNHFSKHPVRYKLWGYISRLNGKHQELAWTTLATLAITDFYIMAVSAGWISDLRIVG